MNEKKKTSHNSAGVAKGQGKAARPAGGGRRCPHCGYRMAAKEIPPGPVKLCPACRMVLPQGDLA